MKVLFVVTNGFYVRNFESVICGLARNGHKVVLAREESPLDDDGRPTAAEAVLRSFQEMFDKFEGRIELATLPPRGRSMWRVLASQARALRDYSRYLLPTHRRARRCAERAASVLISPLRLLGRVPERYRDPAARAVARWTAWVEEVLPVERDLLRTIGAIDPDVVLVSPLIDIGSDQVDYVKACRRLRLPIGHCVASWDNLTNKGLIKAVPDRVFVWNDAQKREAVELHGVPEDRVVVTGAQIFDHWFEHKPSRTREAFCKKAKVPADRDIILYTASSVFICRDEIEFVLRWLAAIRGSSSERLRNAAVIIRPHPKAMKTIDQWRNRKLAEFSNVAIFPNISRLSMERSSRNDFYDSLYYCSAVVGINTSAMLEAGIVGRRCFTVLIDEAREGQEGMVHFQHLTRNGFLSVARDLHEHVEQLARELEGSEWSAEASLVSFLRPHGLAQPATPIFVAQVEEMEDMTVKAASLTARLGLTQRLFLLPLIPLIAFFSPEWRVWCRRMMKRVKLRKRIGRARKFLRKALHRAKRAARRVAHHWLGLGRRAIVRGGRKVRALFRRARDVAGGVRRRQRRALRRTKKFGRKTLRKSIHLKQKIAARLLCKGRTLLLPARDTAGGIPPDSGIAPLLPHDLSTAVQQPPDASSTAKAHSEPDDGSTTTGQLDKSRAA